MNLMYICFPDEINLIFIRVNPNSRNKFFKFRNFNSQNKIHKLFPNIQISNVSYSFQRRA